MTLDPDHPAIRESPPEHADPQRPSANLLLWAYGRGLFPMADPDTGIVSWYNPDPRGVFPLDPPEAFHVPRNVAREVRKDRFQIQSDSAFEQVIRACASPRSDDNGSWL